MDEFQIEVKGDELEFGNLYMFALPDVEIVVTLNNSSTVNSHNLVIVQSGTRDEVAAAGITAGPANDWVPPGDPRVIVHTPLLAPGATGEVRFMAPKPGVYKFVCTFPGHNLTMFGSFIVLDPVQKFRRSAPRKAEHRYAKCSAGHRHGQRVPGTGP